MSDSTTTGPVDPLERQIRQVRRRRNLVELQRALYLLIATASGSAALLVMLALGASARLFSIVVWSVGAAVLVTAAMLVLEARRRWLASPRAPAWIDARAGLRGRLATLVETRARPVRPADAFFLPLLTQENLQRLERWRPARLVPRLVPRGALASALATTGLLLIALSLAPGLRPHAPEIIYSDRPVEGLETSDEEDGLPDRIVVAPRPRSRADQAPGAAGADATAEADEQSALARLGSALQDRIRRELWGDAWERMRDAMARAGDGMQGDAGSGEIDDGDDGEPGDDWAALPPEQLALRPRPRGVEGAGGFESTNEAATDAGETPEDTAQKGDGTEDGGARAAGAGNDTDPNLFGPPSARRSGAATMFELALAAPVRTRRGAPRHTSGEPPPDAPDQRPELGASQREHDPVSKMAVPPAYQAIVREVFAHRAPTGEANEARP